MLLIRAALIYRKVNLSLFRPLFAGSPRAENKLTIVVLHLLPKSGEHIISSPIHSTLLRRSSLNVSLPYTYIQLIKHRIHAPAPAIFPNLIIVHRQFLSRGLAEIPVPVVPILVRDREYAGHTKRRAEHAEQLDEQIARTHSMG